MASAQAQEELILMDRTKIQRRGTMSKTLLVMIILSFLVGTILFGCGKQPVSVETPTPTPTPTPSVSTSIQLTMLSITEGDVLIMKSGTNSWLEAQVGMTLESGDTIKAGDDSRAVITFFEGSTIELEAGTEISVTELSTAIDTGATTISLKQQIGKTISRVEKLADPASRYEVETPGAIAAVRGSIMDVYVDLLEGTIIGCEAGNVTGTVGNVTVQISPGTERYAKRGQQFGGEVPIGSTLSNENEDNEDEYPNVGGGGGGGGGQPSRPAIAIAKAANCSEAWEGDKIIYTYTVTNPGDMSLSDVSVTDDKVSVVSYQSGDSDGDGQLDTGETWIFSANYTVTEEDSDPLVNMANVSGTDAGGRTVTDWDEASVTILSSGIAIAKAANCTQAHEGDEITYTYNVTNTGNTPLSNVSVSDDEAGDATYQGGDTNGDNKLDVDETWVFTANYTVTEEDSDPLINVAIASGTDAFSEAVSAQASATVDILRPGIAIAKAANCTEAHEGDEITYTYNVTNTGNTPLSNVSVSDNKTGDAIYQSGDTNGDNKLDVDETWIFSANYTVTEEDSDPLVNMAIVSGTDASGKTVSAEADASVTIVIYGIRIELTWDAASDMDLHFIRPGGAYWDLVDDCHWRNPNPDWGLPGVAEDNPVYSGDDTDGYGPESIYLRLPYEVGTYQCKVHYFDDYYLGPSTATVTIWINDVQVAQYSKELSYDEVWDCASIEWPSGVVAPGLSGESYSSPESSK
jgi:hypothetical protein